MDPDDEEIFRPFTKESLLAIRRRRGAEKVKATVGGRRASGVEPIYGKDKQAPHPDPYLEQGVQLPLRLAALFDRELVGVPLEDVDPFYHNEETFMIVTKKRDIFRFTATDAIWLLSPFNPARRLAIAVLTHEFFPLVIILTILANCGVMMLPSSSKNITEKSEVIFTTIYTLESALKIVARGFILKKFTYLRDAWNWLDFVVISLAYTTFILSSILPNLDIGNLTVLRTFRVLRALKTVAVIPGLKTIVGAVIESVKNLRDVIILTTFSLTVFALTGLQIYVGVLTQKCIKTLPHIPDLNISWNDWNSNESNWHKYQEKAVLCGNATGAGACPDNFTCLAGFGSNPDYGYTSFDSFPSAFLSVFRLMNQDSWESLYQQVLRTAGSWHITFFIVIIFFGSYYLVNLILAVVSMSYDQLQKKMKEDERTVVAEEQALREEEEAREAARNSSVDDVNNSNSPKDSQLWTCYEEPQNHLKFISGSSSCMLYKDIKRLQMSSTSLPTSPCNKARAERVMNKKVCWRSCDEKKLVKLSGFVDPTDLFPYADDISASTPLCSKELGLNLDSAGRDFLASPELTPIIENKGDIAMIELNRKRGRRMSIIDVEQTWSTQVERKITQGCFLLIDSFCVWSCGFPWNKFQKIVGLIVFDPFCELFITLVIILNTVFMALEHDGLDENQALRNALTMGNKVFTYIFIVECAMKLVAMSPKFYFQVGWNLFDFIIVTLSFTEIMLEGTRLPGISAFRTFRLLRVFKLAKNWPTLNTLISIMGKTVGALGNLVFVLIMIVFIFAVMGMQLFEKNYNSKVHVFPGKILPRWNFTDFGHSCMVIFRILCGEWIETMWDCMLVSGGACIPVFVAAVIIGNLVVLNLFLALLLSSFGASNLSACPAADADTHNLAEAFNRIHRFCRWVAMKVYKFLRFLISPLITLRNHMTPQIHQKRSQSSQNEKSVSTVDPISTPIRSKHSSFIDLEEKLASEAKANAKSKVDKMLKIHNASERNDNATSSIQPNSAVDTQNGANDTDNCLEDFDHTSFSICLEEPRNTYDMNWAKMRKKVYCVVQSKYFEMAIITMILLSSIALAIDDIDLPNHPTLQDSLFYTDRIFTFVFILEMGMKWIALGMKQYFSNAWCWLDFFVVLVSVINLIAEYFPEVGGVPAFKTMRTLRVMSKMEGMRVVVNSLVLAIPGIFNVLLVCLIFWLIFAIMGVQLFAGKFSKCVNLTDGTVFDYTIVPNRSACNNTVNSEVEWANSEMNFDNVGKAYLSLFQVATFKGWMPIMYSAVDAREKNEQPVREYNFAMYLYFVIFIIFGAFFTLNLFVGVIIDKFNEQTKSTGGSMEMLMTADQKKYYAAMKKMGDKKPLKAIPRPRWKPQAILFELVTNQKFDILIMTLIGVNMLTMTMDHYKMTKTWVQTLEILNIIFIALFTVECLLKIIALRYYYFKNPWNMFDFVVVSLSVSGILLTDLIAKYFVSPTLLRVVRVAKIGRVLRLVKGATGIRTLLFALAMSFPALFNICLLLFLLMFIYAIFGMSLFMHVKLGVGGLDEVYNFQTFGKSFILLFQMSTSAGWHDVFTGITNEKNCTLTDHYKGTKGNCGSKALGTAYLLSYLFISFLIIINMYIAVIFEKFSQATEEFQQGLTDDDYDMYYEIWAQFDPTGSYYIQFKHLPDLLDCLEPPLQIRKPNKYKIISMDIPICKDDLVHCVDILDALTRDFFARKGNPIEDITEVILNEDTRPGPISSTLWRQREEYCAMVIQKFWREHKKPLTDF